MKTFIDTVSNTLKAVKLLSNPHFSEMLQKEMQEKTHTTEAFHHKHYTVQVLN